MMPDNTGRPDRTKRHSEVALAPFVQESGDRLLSYGHISVPAFPHCR